MDNRVVWLHHAFWVTPSTPSPPQKCLILDFCITGDLDRLGRAVAMHMLAWPGYPHGVCVIPADGSTTNTSGLFVRILDVEVERDLQQAAIFPV
jgi:hypothetical protein